MADSNLHAHHHDCGPGHPADGRVPQARDSNLRAVYLHISQLGPGQHGSIVSIRSPDPQPPAVYRFKLVHIHDLSHLTVEVEQVA